MIEKFWEKKLLSELTKEEWESLCDGCGKCCVLKLENVDNKKIYYTNVSCKLLNRKNIKCNNYKNRKKIVPNCIKLSPKNINYLKWMPKTCAYRRINEGKKLFDWHPLISKRKNSTIESGNSIYGKILSENNVKEDDLIYYLYDWNKYSEIDLK